MTFNLDKYASICLLAFLVSCGIASDDDTTPPNILVIVADDLGHAELGAFGSEIPTPHLDALALAGTRFSQLRSAPTCSATRAMLLSGVDHHLAGLGNMAEELAPNQKGKPGYEGYLNHRVLSVATLLRDSGYRTLYSGKWHLGTQLDQSPLARGFQHSFAMLAGGSHHFDDMKPAYSPHDHAVAPYRDGDQMLKKLPKEFQYSSQYLVDRLIVDLKKSRSTQSHKNIPPFFAVLSHMAPHWPLQAPQVYVNKFKGQYDVGSDVIAERRLSKQKKIGLIDRHSQLAAYAPKGKNWQSMSTAQRTVEARAMEIYAGMVYAMDYHTGRLLNYLRTTKELENTVVIFLSDNGAEGHDLDDTWPAKLFPKIRARIDSSHDFSYEQMGKKNSYVLYGPNWARAGAPAFKHFKGFVSEGGIRVPAFIYYPRTIAAGVINHQPFHVKDLAPTILDFAGITNIHKKYSEGDYHPITGWNILPYLTSKPSKAIQRDEFGELFGKRYVLRYPWKLTQQPQPYGTGQWQLYNLAEDLAESNNLASQNKKLVDELVTAWGDYAKQNNIIIPNWTSGY